MPVILMFHGNNDWASRAIPAMRPLADRGYGLVLAEYRGYSGNPGVPNEAGLIADARAQLGWVRDHWPGAPLILWGESLGTGVAVAIAKDSGTIGLVLDSPFTSIREIAQAFLPSIPVGRLLRSPFESLLRMPSIRVPVLVLTGEADRVVPPWMGRRVLSASVCQRSSGLFLPGVGHMATRSDQSGRAMRTAVAFLATLPTDMPGCRGVGE